MHEHGAAVLDLKPANLIFDGDQLKVADFGLSSVAEVTMTGSATAAAGAGTPYYMPPEQFDPGVFGRPGVAADV